MATPNPNALVGEGGRVAVPKQPKRVLPKRPRGGKVDPGALAAFLSRKKYAAHGMSAVDRSGG